MAIAGDLIVVDVLISRGGLFPAYWKSVIPGFPETAFPIRLLREQSW